MKNISGFGDDPLTGTIRVPDEVWDMEVERQPAIREFQDKLIGNITELEEILNSVQATERHAIYPESSQPYPFSINSSFPVSILFDSDGNDSVQSSQHTKRKRTKDYIPVTPLGRVR